MQGFLDPGHFPAEGWEFSSFFFLLKVGSGFKLFNAKVSKLVGSRRWLRQRYPNPSL